MRIIDDDGTTREAEPWEAAAIEEARKKHEEDEGKDGRFPQWDEAKAQRALFAALVTNVEIPLDQAVHIREYYPEWSATAKYAVGDRVNHMDALWRCLQAHDAQEGWSPSQAPSLWAKVLIDDLDPEAEPPEWVQPDSTNPYNQGDRVRHNGKVWVSTVANNVWEPGVYGWDEVAS
jgi:hypothetical protein